MKETLHEGQYVRLVRENGWEFVERTIPTGIVLIVAVTEDDRVLLLEQFRPPVGRPTIELPAGLAGDIPGHRDESMATAARRELLEETGYRATDMVCLTEGPPSPGISSEVISLFLATGLEKVGDGGGDETEDIIVHEVALGDVDRWLEERRQEGYPVDPKVYAGLYFVSRRSS